MTCTICGGKGYFYENQAECRTCTGTGKVYTMTMDEVFNLMYSSANANEWEHNCAIVTLSYSGELPYFWYDLIIKSGVMKDLQQVWRG